MNLPGTSFRQALLRYVRTRLPSAGDFLRAAVAETQPLRSDHGGPIGLSGTDSTGYESEENAQRRRRAATVAAIAWHLGLPSDANLDIEVTTAAGNLQFVIRDRADDVTVILDEADAERIVARLQNVTGGLIDRSI